jgi:hypothetical protein
MIDAEEGAIDEAVDYATATTGKPSSSPPPPCWPAPSSVVLNLKFQAEMGLPGASDGVQHPRRPRAVPACEVVRPRF